MTAELTTESIIPSDQQQSPPHKTESVKSTTKSSNIDAASTAPTTDNSTNVKHQQITSTTDPTTGNIIVANALNHDHIKAKSKYTWEI